MAQYKYIVNIVNIANIINILILSGTAFMRQNLTSTSDSDVLYTSESIDVYTSEFDLYWRQLLT